MRATTCLAAVLGTTSLTSSPGVQAFAPPVSVRTAGSATSCHHGQRGSFCSGAHPVAAKNPGALSSAGVVSAATRGHGALSMAEATSTATQPLPWIDGTLPRDLPDEISKENPLRVVIAGGGVGGLLSAKYLKMQGYDVSLSLFMNDAYHGESFFFFFGRQGA